MIETPDPSDPLTPVRLAIRVLWGAAAEASVMFEPLRIRLDFNGPVFDELAAAEALLRVPGAVALSACPDRDVLDIRTSAVSTESKHPSWVFDRLEVRDSSQPTIVAWTAGRGLRVSRDTLIRAARVFRVVNAGFIAAYDRCDLDRHLTESLGIDPAELTGVEWVILAGRPRSPGLPGGTAPLRRVVHQPLP